MSFKDINVQQGDGLFLKLKEGSNRIRIVSEPVELWKAFVGGKCIVYSTYEDARFDKNAKQRFYMWVIDRVNGDVKILDAGAQIIGQVQALAVDEDYGFDDIPPYDVKITRKGVGMDTEYTVLQSPPSELTAEEKASVKAKIADKGTLREIIAKDSQPTVKVAEDISMSSVPF